MHYSEFISVRIPTGLRKLLKEHASENLTSEGQIIRIALRDFFKEKVTDAKEVRQEKGADAAT